jgi:hypothetical protein
MRTENKAEKNKTRGFILIFTFTSLFSIHQASALEEISIGTKIANDYSN